MRMPAMFLRLSRVFLVAAMLSATNTVSAQAFDDAIADTYISEAAPGQNFGSAAELPAKNQSTDHLRVLYQFDFAAIPVGARITQANLWLRVTVADESGDPVRIHRVTSAWSEATATWNSVADQYDPAVSVSFVPDKEGWAKIDILPLVQSWVCGTFSNHGLMLIPTSANVESRYSSRDWNPAENRPRLYLRHSGMAVCPSIDHFVVIHDGYGINCLDETITVRAEDVSGNPVTNYTEQITLDTQTGDGTWTLVAGSGTFDDATPGDGLATYTWPSGESEAVFSLSYEQGTNSFDIDVYQTSDTLLRDDDTEGSIAFSPNGFTLTAAPLANPPPATIVPFSAPQTAGADFPIYIAAYGQTPNDPVCGIIEAYTGTKNLKFWFDYVDPVAGSVAATIDSAGIPASEAAASNQSVTFANGQAAVTGKYKDVGLLRISVKDDSQAHPDLPTGIRGATADFVVKPFRFVLSNVEDGSGNPNPAAADASGPAFVAAGTSFSATVTSLDAEGDVTPNYGQEIVPESVLLTPTLVRPTGGNNPVIGAPTGFGPFASGQATGTDFSWPEVGIITLTPSVRDGDYLGAGDVSGSTTGNVGRFHAHHFTTTLNVPTFATGCAAGSFTYVGQPFNYSSAPVVTFAARALSGEVTENYTGAFFKVDNASLPDPVYTATPAMLDTSGLPPGSSDPAVVDLGLGVGTLTFSGGTGLSFTRGAEEPPFVADVRLSIDLIDSDAASALPNPVIFGDPGGIVFDNGAMMRYGRARVLNAYGSELVDLALPLRTEYFIDAATGFVTHADDACSDGVTLALGAFTENLAPGETCVHDSGSPGASGEGCAAPGPPALTFREPPLGGDFNLNLRAPGAGNDGSTTATADVPAWLEYDWNVALPGFEDPSGTAVFGIYSGADRRIYLREVY